ncbi:MAG: YihY/virulence factor BrkB family protein [Defluviitaleaceae bacterium]|nr:YihY/virulence factor BrkB family protein [Defluviitaleaceae bacterium]
MRNFLIFVFNLIIKCSHDNMLERAAGLTLRVLLAFFPFLIFLMSLMGFLELDIDAILGGLYAVLPDDASDLVAYFITQLSATRSGGILSAALFFSVYNTTNGFRAVISYTNRSYDVEDRRGFFARVGLSFALTLIFTAALIIMLALLVFWRHWLSLIAALFVLFIFTSFIYKLACSKPLPARHIFPGAVVTVFAWVIASYAVGLITQNFSQLPAIYGSFAGVFVLILWINTVAVVLLVGNEINAMLHEFDAADILQ